MKAVICARYGPPEVLQLHEVEKPVPGDHDVLIKVRSSTVTMVTVNFETSRFHYGLVYPCDYSWDIKNQEASLLEWS